MQQKKSTHNQDIASIVETFGWQRWKVNKICGEILFCIDDEWLLVKETVSIASGDDNGDVNVITPMSWCDVLPSILYFVLGMIQWLRQCRLPLC